MPTTQNTINLIQTKTSNTPHFDAIEVSLRKSAMTSLLIFVCVSIVTGSVYLLFNAQQASQNAEKKQLITRVNSLKNKEAYLLAIKDRTKTVEKVIANQKPWSHMLDLIKTFANPPSLSAISVDESDRISISVKTQSLEQIVFIIKTIIDAVAQNKISNPQLLSFQLGKTGFFEVSIAFHAVFSQL